MGVWAERFATPGVVAAEVFDVEPGGVRWLAFPLETGSGEAEAVLRLEGDEAHLPLGGRPGEFELALALRPGPMDRVSVERRQAAAAAAVALEQEAWRRGEFLLVDGGRTVGDVRLRADLAPWLAVYDPSWMSPAWGPADREDDGGDMVLTFPVEPSLAGEEGQIRVNVALGEVVVPRDALPTPGDRHLSLVPGVVTEEERERLVAIAAAEADRSEADWIGTAGAELARAARAGGGCLEPAEVDPSWPALLVGYEVSVVAVGDECVVEIEPVVPQQGRRFRGRVGPLGPVP